MNRWHTGHLYLHVTSTPQAVKGTVPKRNKTSPQNNADLNAAKHLYRDRTNSWCTTQLRFHVSPTPEAAEANGDCPKARKISHQTNAIFVAGLSPVWDGALNATPTNQVVTALVVPCGRCQLWRWSQGARRAVR